jgi:cell cycle arrest protein BUB3
MSEIMLVAPPSDGISNVSFSRVRKELLLVTSWDSTTRLYDVMNNTPKATYDFGGACLSCCFDLDDKNAYSGGLDTGVYMLDIERGVKNRLGNHSKPVSCMGFSEFSNSL